MPRAMPLFVLSAGLVGCVDGISCQVVDETEVADDEVVASLDRTVDEVVDEMSDFLAEPLPLVLGTEDAGEATVTASRGVGPAVFVERKAKKKLGSPFGNDMALTVSRCGDSLDVPMAWELVVPGDQQPVAITGTASHYDGADPNAHYNPFLEVTARGLANGVGPDWTERAAALGGGTATTAILDREGERFEITVVADTGGTLGWVGNF